MASPRSPHELKLNEVARRHSKGTVDIGQGSAEFSGQSTSRSDFQGHWNPMRIKSVSRPTAGGSVPQHTLGRKGASPRANGAPNSPLSPRDGAKFEGQSSMRADFGSSSEAASPRPRTSMAHKGSGNIISGGAGAGDFSGQSTARSSYGAHQPGQRRESIRRKPQLQTDKARFEGVSTMRQDYTAERAASGSPRHPKTAACVDHIRLQSDDDGQSQYKAESVTRRDYTAKKAERRPAATNARIDHVQIGDGTKYSKGVESVTRHDYRAKKTERVAAATAARVDHVVIGDANDRSSKGVESVTRHDYTAKQTERRPAATNARIDHVQIGDGTKYSKGMESVQRADFTGERGEVPQPSNTGRVDHVIIADGSQAAPSAERRSSVMSTSY